MARNGVSGSPYRRSLYLLDPENVGPTGLLSQEPHSEMSHKEALEAARQYHEDVRERACFALEKFHLEEQQKKVKEERQRAEARTKLQQQILEEQKKTQQEQVRRIKAQQELEKSRIAAEEREAQEAAKLHALQVKKIPIPEPPPATTATSPTPKVTQPGSTTSTAVTLSATTPKNGAATTATAPPSVPAKTALMTATSQTAATTQEQQQNQDKASVVTRTSVSPLPSWRKDSIVRVHQNLKKLRRCMSPVSGQAKTNPQLKAIMGEMRRNIGKWVGQLSINTSQNKQQVAWIIGVLQEARSGAIPSLPVDPNEYLFEKRDPVPDGPEEPAQLPSLFLYLVNILAKKIVKQFAEECGANPKQADSLGVLSAQVFSRPVALWRGKSIIDILMTKFYVICPVVIGARGNEKTNEGRAAVGWQCHGSNFIPDTLHYNRMTGLGAGFAALTLRDFSGSSATSPWPPWNYWKAFSLIVNTPPEEICSTQLVVLKSMIENHEQRFLLFYGNIAAVALRTALVELPSRCVEQNSAVGALKVLGELLSRNTGFPLT